ncbi:sensor histidine kinase [Candidatus Soleaferrea massiliensis]|uniref:sensor histidine kinase n=1 Tax=Candidatus Soleaferrea massiliensis TaxID=1470354 RepID=UPI00058D1AB3|nr:ATP-binding protein [Candidatus Soleaferrea massiliensis]
MKRPGINSLAQKGILLIVSIGLAFILLISLFLPDILYSIMKPHISSYVSSLINANTIRQSVIWRLNRVAFTGHDDDELKEWLLTYEQGEQDDALKEKILSKVPVQKVGVGGYQIRGEGAISVTTYSMIYINGGDTFYQPESRKIASIVLESDWIHTLSPDMSYTYSPVIYSDSREIPSIICFTIPIRMDELDGYIIHMLDFSCIQTQFRELEDIGIHDYMLLQQDRVLYQNPDTHIKLDRYPDWMYQGVQYQTMVQDTGEGMDFMTLCSYQEEDFRVVVHADKKTLLAPYQQIFFLIQLIIYVIILTLLVTILLASRGSLRRLTKLNQKMDCVKQGDYDVTLKDPKEDEIGNLAQTFNMMLGTIKQDIDHKVESERKEQQMQYSLLVSAIDPHFIYNTLNVITILARRQKCSEIVSVNKALIGTLKDRLTTKNCKTFDSLAVEREVLDQYMIIQSYLCHNNIDYTFEVCDDDLALQIPKNILQPLVENCIKHGLLPHKDADTREILDGMIRISVQRQEDRLRISIADNGVGMDDSQIETYFYRDLQSIVESESEHIGIYNIRMRLSYLYQDRCQWMVQSEKGKGTVITLMLPVDPDKSAT